MRALHILVPAIGAVTASAAAQTSSLSRDRDPVVIVGSSLEPLTGLPVGEIVAFRRQQDAWHQIPVQIDERKYVDFGLVYNQDPVGILTLTYADATTYTGADTDPTFDDDDELVLMARDVGDRAGPGAGAPAGVVANTGVELEITDPLDGGVGYVYLFQSDGTLSPDAGQDYVTYVFDLLAGDYIPDYNTLAGPNPEDSQAFSVHYRTHFSDRWIRDEVNIYTGGSSGADVFDRHKNMFAPGNCARTEDTFSGGEGAFFTNKDGPVRAIRSYMGANSGPLTQREHFFYEQRQDITTFLRVHAISGVMDLYDYSPEAAGMFYFNDANLQGVPVDGQPDAVIAAPLLWEMVTGAQGSLIISHSLETDIEPFAYTSFYSDDTSPQYTQCTGDAFEYATSGLWLDQAIPNTDPALGAHNMLTSRRVVFYEPPGQTVQTAALRFQQASTLLEVTVRRYPLPVIETVASMADHGAAGQIGLNVNLAAATLPADSALATTESREAGITKLVIDCDGDVTLPSPPESLVQSIVGVSNGDVTANVLSVTAVADVITINLTPLPDQDTYTVTLTDSAIAGDNNFLVRSLQGEVDNGGVASQVVNALDLSDVRMHFAADVTVDGNAKYDIISDGSINALDLSECRIQFTHTAP